MSRNGRMSAVVAAVVAALAVCGVVLANVGAGADGVREIRLVAREMTYFAETARDEANPALRLKRGERVRFVLTNDDPGYTHNIASPVLGLSMPLVPSGETRSVEVTVPDVPGLSTYACDPHSQMMRGTIAIE